MGIQGLTKALRPYSETLRLRHVDSCDYGRIDNVRAVVDGPALAYHVQRQCLDMLYAENLQYQFTVSHREIAVATISFLQQVEQYGIIM